MSICESCHAEILWITVAPGNRRMPIDAQPDQEGNVLVDLHRHTGIVVSAADLELLQEVGKSAGAVYRSHFASCPDAKRWRHR